MGLELAEQMVWALEKDLVDQTGQESGDPTAWEWEMDLEDSIH